MSYSFGYQCFAVTWISPEQYPTIRFYAQLFKEFRSFERQFDHHPDILDDIVHPANIGKGGHRYTSQISAVGSILVLHFGRSTAICLPAGSISGFQV